LVLPGGIDSHCHIEQRSSAGIVCADDFYSATLSAAFGGTTTVIPFAAQHRGQSLRQIVDEYHQAAGPKAVIDYAFHLIISDPTEQVMGQELPALIRDGYTSFKVYMTYDLLQLDDGQMLDILAVARLRGRYGTGIVMFASTLVFTLILLPLALLEKFLPATAQGWWVLIGCALTAQVIGQGLIAYALAHLPATFGAVGLYVQVVAAGVYAWLLLGERLAPVQIAGGAVVLVAIALARRTRIAPRLAPSAQAQRASIQSSAAGHSESR